MSPLDATQAAQMIIETFPVPHDLGAALAPLLHDLLASERLSGQCVVDVGPSVGPRADSPQVLAAFGLSGFLGDACAEAFIRHPTPNFALAILERYRFNQNGLDLLDFAGVAKANAGEGLTLFPLCWIQRPKDRATPLGAELMSRGMTSFLTHHQGFNLKRILKEGSREQQSTLTRAGFFRLKAMAVTQASGERRVLFGLTREQARDEAYGSAISLLFSSPRPRFGFSRLQRHVLLGAIDDMTDNEIADQLGVSSHAVNMRWRTIYETIDGHVDCATIFGLSDANRADLAMAHRRRRVTAFARAHPEELRPYAR